jgi:tetratricopeptide (TPR) repeat protein
MSSLFDFSQALSKLNKEKKFAEALKYFKDGKNEFTPEQIGLNKYIVYDMISALIETNHYDVIFTFIEQYNVVLDPKNFSYLLKKFKDKPSVNWAVVNKFCDLVSVDSLETECRTIEVERKGEKKPMELASSKEEWYAVKSKALFEIQHYQECFDFSKKALESFEKFHYSNEVWFARRIALSKKHLGNSVDALNELLLILRRKKEWFIQNEVAEIYKENGDYEKAFKFAISAINNFGDLEYKVGLLVLIAELLALKEEMELSFKHYSLSKLLRQQEGWNIPNSVSSALSQFSFEQITIEKLPDLKRELKKYWSSFNPQQTESRQNTTQRQTGKIDRILHNDEKGADGFIKYDGNKSIYFRVNTTEEIIKIIAIGLEVEFKILPATEDKKEKAVQLKVKV